MNRRNFLKGLLATGVVALAAPSIPLPVQKVVVTPIVTPPLPAMEWYWQQVSGSVVISGYETFAVPCEVIRSTAYGAAYAKQHAENKIIPLLNAKLEMFQKSIRDQQLKLLYGDGRRS